VNGESARILVIDDEPSIRNVLGNILGDEGHEATLCATGEEGLTAFGRDDFDLLILDLWLPGMDGLSVLEQIRKRQGAPPVIVISGHGSVEAAVKATRLGAYDFLEKPLSLERIVLTVQHALADRRLREEVRSLKRHLVPSEALIGESEPMRRLARQIESAAPTSTRVLITGENGSGKEVVARTLHRLSLRADAPFVDVNCAAIPEELIESELFGHRKGAFTGAIDDRRGKFELAHTGTLFLDEIGDMSLKTQAKVLRVLQEQQFQKVGGQKVVKVDVRVIAATNKNLEEEIRAGNFREDLLFRINVIPINVPPLRERGDDVALLANHFLQQLAAETGRHAKSLSATAVRKLRSYSWPGNVRELRNVMERLTILAPADVIEPEQIELGDSRSAPAAIPTDLPLREARERFEREYIVRKLSEMGGNVSRTAEALGIERSNLYRKLNAYGIEVERG